MSDLDAVAPPAPAEYAGALAEEAAVLAVALLSAACRMEGGARTAAVHLEARRRQLVLLIRGCILQPLRKGSVRCTGLAAGTEKGLLVEGPCCIRQEALAVRVLARSLRIPVLQAAAGIQSRPGRIQTTHFRILG